MPEIHYANHQPLTQIVAEIKSELKEFVQTRVRLAATELSEAARTLSGVTLAAVAGILLAVTGYLCFVAAVVSLVAVAFANTWYQWPLAFGIVSVLLLATAGIALAQVQNTLRSRTLLPEKTIEVLKADTRVWNHQGREAYE